MSRRVVGRFAPTPSGRMHLGNLYCALIAWLSAKSSGGALLLRIEDLDHARCRMGAHAKQILADLAWLGIDWEGEVVYQSRRTADYQRVFSRLMEDGLLYPCFCSRAELHAATAPHQKDGVFIYPGTCRGLTAQEAKQRAKKRPPAYRIQVPNQTIRFEDGCFGMASYHLKTDCGDVIVRRSDGVYAYHLAVVVDDHDSGVNQVVRGRDLLGCVPIQQFLYQALGWEPPCWVHIPLLLTPDGRRLSKREKDIGADRLKATFQPEQVVGELAFLCGLIPKYEPVKASELLPEFSIQKLPKTDIRLRAQWLNA